VCQLELSADSAGKLGVKSKGQDAETAEQTTGTAEQDVGTVVAKVSTRPPKAEQGVQRWVEARARRTPKLPRAVGLPLLLPELLALVLQADGSESIPHSTTDPLSLSGKTIPS
jgi:hypothetical protein